MIGQLEEELDIVERHMQVLSEVVANEPIGIVNLSRETGYPKHKVRYSLRVLEKEGLISPSSQGARTTDEVEPFLDGLDDELEAVEATVSAMKSAADRSVASASADD